MLFNEGGGDEPSAWDLGSRGIAVLMIQQECFALPALGVICQRGQSMIVDADSIRLPRTHRATARMVGVLERPLRKPFRSHPGTDRVVVIVVW